MLLDTSYCQYDAVAKRLYCTLPWIPCTLRVRSWFEGCRVEVEENGGWSAQTDVIDLPVVSDLLTGGDSGHPIARYARELPQEVVRGVAAFAYGQLAMLQVCAASQRGEQLLRNAPVLFWLIAPELMRRNYGEPETLHTLLGLRQKDLLEMICGRGNNALIRLLAKVPPPTTEHISHELLIAILAREEASSLLRHKRNVDWRLIALIARQGDKISNPLIRGILMSDMDWPAMTKILGKLDRIVTDTTNLGKQLDIADTSKLVAACTDWQSLLRLHDAWTERLHSMKLDAIVRKYGEGFPQPPIPGTDAIQPICSVRELLLEGMTMHHCVGSYIDAVRSGSCYIYRVMEPERATLEIKRNKSGAWVQGQLTTYCNGSPGQGVVRRAQEWFIENSSRQAPVKNSNGQLPLPGMVL